MKYRKTEYSRVLLSVMTVIIHSFTASGNSSPPWQDSSNLMILITGGGYNDNIFSEKIGKPVNNGQATGIYGDHTIALPNAKAD